MTEPAVKVHGTTLPNDVKSVFRQGDDGWYYGIRFIKEAGADTSVLQIKSLEAFAKAADGQSTKIIIPSDLQGIAGLATTFAEVVKDQKTE